MESPFQILIAGKVIGIHAMFAEIRNMCRDYLTDADPDFEVSTSPEDIISERQKSDREAVVEGRKPSSYTDAYLETLAVYRKIAAALLDDNILLFHGSVIAVDGVGYLFTAKSGTGKSTHTRLWREQFGSRAMMVNDDKPLLKITEHGVSAYGTPWDGKHHLSTNTAVPLKAICVLTRGETNHIERANKKDVFPLLCQQSHRIPTPEAMTRTLTLIDQLSNSVALYRLACNMDPEAAMVAYRGMNP